MCSINGFTFEDNGLVEKMNTATTHRGPDGTGVFVEVGVSLGHNRLAIIDLSKEASQPMKSGDSRFVIVYNGELYNFQELKRELAYGYSFQTKSDTEVILAAYEKWGGECVTRFNGIFAFAIWDRKKKELFLARDHVGVKPLYYFHKGNTLIFSSEIKGILEHPIPRVLNRAAFNHYLRILYVPAPLTIVKNIYKLPPAHTAVYKNGNLETQQYWRVSENTPFTKSMTALTQELRGHMGRAVKRQLLSDRPLGLYLSGGIDSSVVLHHVRQLRDTVDTFSVGFALRDGEEEEKFNADFHLAARTAKHYGTQHHTVMMQPQDVPELFEKSVRHLGDLVSNPTELAMLTLAQFAKKKVAVALGGDGGDELFGGYERYRLSRIASMYQRLPLSVRGLLSHHPRLKKLNTPSGIERFALFMFQKNNVLEEVVHPEFFQKTITADFFHKNFFSDNTDTLFEEVLMNTDRQSWLVDESLTLTDAMSMAAGLEVRVPFLDKDIVSFAQQVPLKYKVNLFHTKILLKQAYKEFLPEYLFNQPKRGWFSPAAKWLRYPEMAAFAREVLSPDYYQGTKDMFVWNTVERMLNDHIEKRRYNLTLIWALMTFQMFAKQYKMGI